MMKRAAAWVTIVAFIAFVLFWFVAGPKMFDGSGDIAEYAGFVCILLIIGCAVFRLLYNRCPKCRRWIRSNETNCPHCVDEDE